MVNHNQGLTDQDILGADFGPYVTKVAEYWRAEAKSLMEQGKIEEVKQLYARLMTMAEGALGAEATKSVNEILEGNYDDATIKLYERAHATCQSELGPDHEHTQTLAAAVQHMKMKLPPPFPPPLEPPPPH